MPRSDLCALARLYGIQCTYRDSEGRAVRLRTSALLAVIRACGGEALSAADTADALRLRRQACWRQVLQPVSVAWLDKPAAAVLRLPEPMARGAIRCTLDLEEGPQRLWEARLEDLPTSARRRVDGAAFVRKTLALPADIPPGYHRLEVNIAGQSHRSLVIASPPRAYAGPRRSKRLWGVFLPLHALRTRRSWATADLTDLAALADWTAGHGGHVVGTLPLLSHLWELDADPSPYFPASRLFTDETYLDLSRLPACASPPVLAILAAPPTAAAIRRMRAGRMADYHAQAELKGRVLRAAAGEFFRAARPSHRRDLEQFLAANPRADDFARFRAACRKQAKPWWLWPAPMRDGQIGPDDYDEQEYHAHLLAQWQLDLQSAALLDRCRRRGVLLYLDMPLGCDAAGYDGWRWRDLFVPGMSIGAPPDSFHVHGQDWGFAPPHPRRLRESGYDYFIQSVRAQLRRCSMLRIDHVMLLHRLYWIPRGARAGEGVYVRYAAEEMAAILCLESHRHRAMIVGEDLGTVAPALRRILDQRGLLSMYILPGELHLARLRRRLATGREPKLPSPLRPVPPNVLAALNTHDMPTFTTYWRGGDIRQRLLMGLLDEPSARRERRNRRDARRTILRALQEAGLETDGRDLHAVLQNCLVLLGRSDARVLLANLEDLWLEPLQQNWPARPDQPNWRRRARYRLEDLDRYERIATLLARIRKARADRPPDFAESSRPTAGRSRSAV